MRLDRGVALPVRQWHLSIDFREPYRTEYMWLTDGLCEPMDAPDLIPAGSCVLVSSPDIGMAFASQTRVSR